MTIDRNPDVDLDAEKVPAGLVLIEGKHLMTTARAAMLAALEKKKDSYWGKKAAGRYPVK